MNTNTPDQKSKAPSTLTAFCATCPDPEEVSLRLREWGFHLVFSMPADLAGAYMDDLPPLPAQYHYADAVGTRLEYLAGVDTPCLDDDESVVSMLRFPVHASRFWLTPGAHELAAKRIQEQMAQTWALQWLAHQPEAQANEAA